MNHIGTQIIRTQRLILRRFTLEDAPAMFRNWANDQEVTKYLTWPPHGSEAISRQVLESWVSDYERDDDYQWAIELDGEIIGSIGVTECNDKTQMMELGYCIGKRWWHQGIMTEAVKAVLNYLFSQVGVNRVQARHAVDNPNSGRVMAKCGMCYEGTLRQADWCTSGVRDVRFYGILKAEWKKESRE